MNEARSAPDHASGSSAGTLPAGPRTARIAASAKGITMGLNPSELGRGLFRVLETGDRALAADVVHEDFRNREAAVAPAACSLPGPAGVLASSAWMRSAFDGLRFAVVGVVHEDDQVWVRLHMQGRHTGPFVRFRDGELDQVIPPTGQDIDFEQIHVLGLCDGRIVSHEAVRDDVTMLGQLGVFPPNPGGLLRMVGWRLTGRASRAAAAVSAAAAEAASHQ